MATLCEKLREIFRAQRFNDPKVRIVCKALKRYGPLSHPELVVDTGLSPSDIDDSLRYLDESKILKISEDPDFPEDLKLYSIKGRIFNR